MSLVDVGWLAYDRNPQKRIIQFFSSKLEQACGVAELYLLRGSSWRGEFHTFRVVLGIHNSCEIAPALGRLSFGFR